MSRLMQCECGAMVGFPEGDDSVECPICHEVMSDFEPEALPKQPKCKCGATMGFPAGGGDLVCLQCGRVWPGFGMKESIEFAAARIENERIGRELLEKAKTDLRGEGAPAQNSERNRGMIKIEGRISADDAALRDEALRIASVRKDLLAAAEALLAEARFRNGGWEFSLLSGQPDGKIAMLRKAIAAAKSEDKAKSMLAAFNYVMSLDELLRHINSGFALLKPQACVHFEVQNIRPTDDGLFQLSGEMGLLIT